MRKKLFAVLLIAGLFFYSSCSMEKHLAPEDEKAVINIEVASNQLFVQGVACTLEEFSTRAQKEIDQLKSRDLPNDAIIVHLKAAKEVKMGSIADVQFTLRDLGLRKVIYGRI